MGGVGGSALGAQPAGVEVEVVEPLQHRLLFLSLHRVGSTKASAGVAAAIVSEIGFNQ